LSGPSSARLRVHLKPGASESVIEGWMDGELVVRVRERPIDNRANEAMIALLADALHVARGSLRIVSGGKSRHKTVEAEGRAQDWLDGALKRPDVGATERHAPRAGRPNRA